MIGRKSSSMRKWNAGVRILRRAFHLDLFEVTSPSPSHGLSHMYSTDLSVRVFDDNTTFAQCCNVAMFHVE